MASAVIAGQDPVETARLLATELERARRFGFTDEELDAAKRAVLNRYAQAAAEGDKSESGLAGRRARAALPHRRARARHRVGVRARQATPPDPHAGNHQRPRPDGPRRARQPAVRHGRRTAGGWRHRSRPARRGQRGAARRHRALSRHQGRDATAGAGARTRPAALGDERRDARHDDPDVCQRHARRPEAHDLQERRGLPGRGPVRRAVPLRPGRPSERGAPGQHHRGHGLRHADADGASAVPGHPPRERRAWSSPLHGGSGRRIHARRHRDDAAARVPEAHLAPPRRGAPRFEPHGAQRLPRRHVQQPHEPVRGLRHGGAVEGPSRGHRGCRSPPIWIR